MVPWARSVACVGGVASARRKPWPCAMVDMGIVIFCALKSCVFVFLGKLEEGELEVLEVLVSALATEWSEHMADGLVRHHV
jgi:hypothetical protein